METGHQNKVSESLLSSQQTAVSERESINRPCVGTSDEILRNEDHNYCIGCGACRGNANDDSSRKSSFLWCVIAALVIIILSIIINWLL
ncbi:MAG: hypothetical protein GX924_03965 [Clostridiaceae bacterium]|nr:hypothetical protein [Clostridiaceae bacterium]